MISQVFKRKRGTQAGHVYYIQVCVVHIAYVQIELCDKRRLREESKVCKVLESKVRKPKLEAERELRENYPRIVA